MAEAEYGLKRLTEENWLAGDFPFYGMYDGVMRPMTGSDWAPYFLDPCLAKELPLEIHRLYNVARGSMLYGYFFYPLFTAGIEQMFRVAEAAISIRCQQLGCPRKIRDFKDRIEFLVENGTIPAAASADWHAFRYLRNEASHPKDQTLFTPGMVTGLLRSITEAINTLFRLE